MNPRTLFRSVAIAEAVSWALLLVAMFFKWILEAEPLGLAEGGVPVAGPIHGAVFVVYVGMCLMARQAFAWSPRTTLLALAASIPPLFTCGFERWADRSGHLTEAPVSSPSA